MVPWTRFPLGMRPELHLTEDTLPSFVRARSAVRHANCGTKDRLRSNISDCHSFGNFRGNGAGGGNT